MSRSNTYLGNSVKAIWEIETGSEDWSSNLHESGFTVHVTKPNTDSDKFDPDNFANSNVGVAGYIDITKVIDEIGVWRFNLEYYYDTGHGLPDSIVKKCFEEITVTCRAIPIASAKITKEQLDG